MRAQNGLAEGGAGEGAGRENLRLLWVESCCFVVAFLVRLRRVIARSLPNCRLSSPHAATALRVWVCLSAVYLLVFPHVGMRVCARARTCSFSCGAFRVVDTSSSPPSSTTTAAATAAAAAVEVELQWFECTASGDGEGGGGNNTNSSSFCAAWGGVATTNTSWGSAGKLELSGALALDKRDDVFHVSGVCGCDVRPYGATECRCSCRCCWARGWRTEKTHGLHCT